jgi:hypothetical protein
MAPPESTARSPNSRCVPAACGPRTAEAPEGYGAASHVSSLDAEARCRRVAISQAGATVAAMSQVNEPAPDFLLKS